MLLRNKNSKGNMMVGAILAIIIVLGAVGFYLFNKQGGGLIGASSKSAVELANFMPADSDHFAAADLSGGIWGMIPRLIDKSKHDENPEIQKQIAEAEAKLGLPLKEFVAYLDGRFAFGLVRTDKNPTGMALVGLKDAKAYQAWMTKKYGESTDTVNEVPFWKLDYGAVMGVNEKWVYWCRSGTSPEAGLKAVEKLILASQGSGEVLAKQALFAKATTQVDLSHSELVTFNNLETLGTQISGIPEMGFDKRTETLLSEIKFAVAGVDLTGRSSEGLMGIEGGETGLAKAMTSAGRINSEAIANFSNSATWLVGLDLQWTMDMVVALGELNTNTRNQVSMIPMGISMMGIPVPAINGDAWVATDLLDVSYEAAKQSVLNNNAPVATPDPSLLALIPTKDNKAIDEFITKSMGGDSSEFKDGEVREYPSPDPTTKIAVDSAKNLIKLSTGQQVASLEATGDNLSKKPMISELQKWGGANIVYLDYIDFSPMAKKLEKEEDPELIAVRDTLKYWGKDNIDGGLCVATSPEGLRYKALGTGGGLTMYTGAIAATAAPNFMRARGQGQLTACKSNQKNIGTALEMYSVDWNGKYPKDTTFLAPNYLKTIPSCPAAGEDTYSQSYKIAKVGPAPGFDGYSFFCSGHNHAEVGSGPNKPAYNAAEGLVE